MLDNGWSRLRRNLLAAAMLIGFVPQPSAAEAPVTGQWQCDYGVRKLSSATGTSSAWFEITITEKGRFHGGGKAIAAGTALPMTLNGAWSLDEDGVLKMTGVSDVANQKVPFRFISDRVDDDTFKRREVRSGAEYKTGCKRLE